MTDYEQEWDRLLNIKTTGRDDTISDFTRYPYEPTDYSVLDYSILSLREPKSFPD